MSASAHRSTSPSASQASPTSSPKPETTPDVPGPLLSSIDYASSEEDLVNYPLQPDDSMFHVKTGKSRVKVDGPQKRSSRIASKKKIELVSHHDAPKQRTRSAHDGDLSDTIHPRQKKIRAQSMHTSSVQDCSNVSTSTFIDSEAKVDGDITSDGDDLDVNEYDLNDGFIDDSPLSPMPSYNTVDDCDSGSDDDAIMVATTPKTLPSVLLPVTPSPQMPVPVNEITPPARSVLRDTDLESLFEKNKDLFMSFLRGAMREDQINPSTPIVPTTSLGSPLHATNPSVHPSTRTTPSTPPKKVLPAPNKGKNKEPSGGIPTPRPTPKLDIRLPHAQPTTPSSSHLTPTPSSSGRSPSSYVSTPKKSITDLLASHGSPSPSAGSQTSPSSESVHGSASILQMCTSLPDVCQVTDPSIQDPLLAEFYHGLPPLRDGQLIPWSYIPGQGHIAFSAWAVACPHIDTELAFSALNFSLYDHWVNPCRASPLAVELRQVSMGSSTRLHMYRGKSPAIGLSSGYVVESQLLAAIPNNGLRQKSISIIMHSQEWERFSAWVCMVFGRDALHAQLAQDTLKFSTRVESNHAHASASSAAPKGMFIKKPSKDSGSQDFQLVLPYHAKVPVYDAREVGFNFTTDLPRMAHLLPTWHDEVPEGSFVVVGYTLAAYFSSSAKVQKWTLSTNIQWVVIVASPVV